MLAGYKFIVLRNSNIEKQKLNFSCFVIAKLFFRECLYELIGRRSVILHKKSIISYNEYYHALLVIFRTERIKVNKISTNT